MYNTVSLDGICRDIIDTLAIESGKKHITVTLDGKAEVTADADNTATIITNLLTNAIKYSEETAP